jgi:hypothetical protein
MDLDTDNEPRRLVPVPEARRTLGEIGHTTIYDLVNRGEIVKVNIGRRSFITSESLEAYLDRLTAASRIGTAPNRDMLTDRDVVDDAALSDPKSAAEPKGSGTEGDVKR